MIFLRFISSLSPLLDPSGAYGGYLHYMLVISLVGSAFLLFIYLWYKGRLDMDEEPKITMMKNEHEFKNNEDSE
jgi:hypothetical protein